MNLITFDFFQRVLPQAQLLQSSLLLRTLQKLTFIELDLESEVPLLPFHKAIVQVFVPWKPLWRKNEVYIFNRLDFIAPVHCYEMKGIPWSTLDQTVAVQNINLKLTV